MSSTRSAINSRHRLWELTVPVTSDLVHSLSYLDVLLSNACTAGIRPYPRKGKAAMSAEPRAHPLTTFLVQPWSWWLTPMVY